MAFTSEEMKATEYPGYTEMENGLLMTTALSPSFRVFRVFRGSLLFPEESLRLSPA